MGRNVQEMLKTQGIGNVSIILYEWILNIWEMIKHLSQTGLSQKSSTTQVPHGSVVNMLGQCFISSLECLCLFISTALSPKYDL